MNLPDHYRTVLDEGTAALLTVLSVIEKQLALKPEDPELLLRWRDVSGLASRLDDGEGWDSPSERWALGFAALELSGQDIGLLLELEAQLQSGLIHAPKGNLPVTVRLTRLREFLSAYLRFEYGAPNSTWDQGGDL